MGRARALSLALFLSAFALSPGARAADEDPRAASRAAFARGVEQLKQQDWTGARASFESAYALFAHPSILLNLGLSRLRTGDVELAERDLSRFLADDPESSPGELSAAREALAEARAKLGTLRFRTTPPQTRVSIEGCGAASVEVSGADGSLEVRCRSGSHQVRFEREGYVPVERAVEVSPGQTHDESVALARRDAVAPPRGGPDGRVVGWSLAGLSAVAVGVGAYAGVRAIGLADEYGDRGSPGFQDPSVRSDGVTLRTVSDVSFVIGIAAAAGAVYFLVFRPGDTPRPEATLRW